MKHIFLSKRLDVGSPREEDKSITFTMSRELDRRLAGNSGYSDWQLNCMNMQALHEVFIQKLNFFQKNDSIIR